jgi:capsular polysaccharide biosynthesis protein
MEIDLKDYIVVVKRRWKLILALVVILTGLVAIWSQFFITPTYEASTKIIVTKSDANNQITSLDLNAVNTNIQLINTYKEVIKTPRIMDLVVKQYPEFGLTSEQLSEKVQVSSVNETQVMTISAEDSSYTLAAAIVNATSEVFQKEISKIMKVDNVSILNTANLNDQPDPIKPNKLLNVAISFVVSLMLGVATAFLIEYLDDTVKSEEDISRLLGLPTLTMIPKIQLGDLERNSQKNMRMEGESFGK